MTRTPLVALLAACAVMVATPALAADSGSASSVPAITATHVPDQVIVGFQPGAAAADRAAARSQVQTSTAERLSPLAVDTELWTLPPGRTVEEAIATLSRNPNVRFAEPNYVLETAAIANDPDFTNGGLWGMYGDTTTPANAFGSQAAEAWVGGATGNSDTYVVVIDEGIQITHPDLAANTWTNPWDAADGTDNDGNGYVDDVNGWDFAGGNNTVYDGTGDDHGTHVSGTIGALGNNGIGVAGVNWDVTLISAKFLGANGGTTANAVKAVDYATDLKTRHGLNIVATSNSWGGGGFSQSLLDAIARGGAQNILFIAAAGNSGGNNDTTASYPSNYNCRTGPSSFDCVVAVAAIDSAGNLASFSQYGATTVDLGAPGVNVRSTLPVDSYGNYSGTSMATPHVSGAAALCASMGSLRGKALKDALLSSTTATASLAGKTVTGGRLDVGTLAPLCGTVTPPPASGPSVTSMSPTTGPAGTDVIVTGSSLTGATVTVGGAPAATTKASDTGLTFTVPPLPQGSYSVKLTVGGTDVPAGSFTVIVPPSAPTIGNASSNSPGKAVVRWTLSTSNGGSPVTGHTVRAYRLSGSSYVSAGTWTNIGGTSTSVNLSGLVRGATYTFTVAARNAAGEGLPSGESVPIRIR